MPMSASEKYAIEKDLQRYGALARILEEWANRISDKFMRAWQDHAHIGYRCDTVARPYTVTERGVGFAMVTFDNGETKTIEAPVPFA